MPFHVILLTFPFRPSDYYFRFVPPGHCQLAILARTEMNYEQLVEFLTNKMSMSHREEHGSWLLRTCLLYTASAANAGGWVETILSKLPRSKEPGSILPRLSGQSR